MGVKFARTTGVTVFNGVRVRLAEDDPWDADDPFVVAHPEHFADRPLRTFGYSGASIDVEQASAAPGEKRNVRRAR